MTTRVSRRRFVQGAAMTAAAAAILPAPMLHATPFGLPLGLQLYSVREQLQTDFAGTLKQVASVGYREVEAAGFYEHSPDEVKKAMEDAGLRCVSGHYPFATLAKGIDPIIDFHKKIRADYIICSSPGRRVPGSHGEPSLDDVKFNAEQFNKWGQQVKAAGLQFGYHNHTGEFAPVDGQIPYDVLLKNTDPKLVVMELDCGWVTVGGGSPEHYLSTYSNRIHMLHVKDFKSDPGHTSNRNPPPAAELGRGVSDYRKILQAAKPGQIKHMFVEQEAYPDLPWLQALRVDADYLKKLTV